MKHGILMLVALLAFASSARAQEPPADALLAPYLQRSYAALSRDLVAAVAMMPEPDLRFRPAGTVKEVRTFGEIVAHLVLVNAFVCAMGDGKPKSNMPVDTALAHDKARLVALLDETNTRCTAYLATLTDTALTQIITSGTPPRTMRAVRGNSIVFAIAHSNEHYGNLVTYLRAKGLVPPAAASQAIFFSTPAPAKP